MTTIKSGNYNKSGWNRSNQPVYSEEDYIRIFSEKDAKVVRKRGRGRPFGSKNTGITKKKGSPDHCVKIEHKEIIISFD